MTTQTQPLTKAQMAERARRIALTEAAIRQRDEFIARCTAQASIAVQPNLDANAASIAASVAADSVVAAQRKMSSLTGTARRDARREYDDAELAYTAACRRADHLADLADGVAA